MSYKYKNKSGLHQIVPGVGEVAAGDEIVSSAPIENPNFELVDQTNEQSIVGTEAPQAGAIVEAHKIAETNNDLEVK